MKKLIIAAVAVACTAVVQAATVQWSASGVYERGSTTTKAGPGYSAIFISSADYALQSAIADLQKGDISFVSTYGQAPKAFGTTTQGANSGSTGTSVITTTAGNSEPWTGYVVIFDAATSSAAEYAFITSEVTKSTGGTGQTATLSFSSLSGTQTASNWYAVPEPTSGLLLLLGVAGLALRRRRA